MMLGYSEGQSQVLAIIPKITGSLSIVASTFIVQHILRSPPMRNRPYHRLLLGMSINDIIGSFFGFVLSTTPMPPESSIYGARGSEDFCSAAGFFNQGGNLTAPLYNGSLATFFLLTIVYGWRENRIATEVELYFHAFPLSLGWGTAIAAACMNLYAPANWQCWIAQYPDGCKSKWRYGAKEATCERGNYAFLFRFLFKYMLVWLTILYVIAIMAFIYRSVQSTERASDKYRYPLLHRDPKDINNSIQSQPTDLQAEGIGEEKHQRFRRRNQSISSEALDQHKFQLYQRRTHSIARRKREKRRQDKSKQIAYQALLYVGALILTFFFSTIVRAIQLSYRTAPFGWMVMMTIFNPLQGFFNLLVYLRPRYLDFCKRNAEDSRGRNLRNFCIDTFCPECIRKGHCLPCLRLDFDISQQTEEDKTRDRSRVCPPAKDDIFDVDEQQNSLETGTKIGHDMERRLTPEDLDFPRMSSLIRPSSIASDIINSSHHVVHDTRPSFSSNAPSRNESICSVLSVQIMSESALHVPVLSERQRSELSTPTAPIKDFPVLISVRDDVEVESNHNQDDPGG